MATFMQRRVRLRPPPDGPTPGRRWAVFLDLDGTLLDFAARPDDVRVDEALSNLLDRLERALGGALALVSGRSVDALVQLFGERGFAMIGVHGAEWRAAGESGVLVSEDSLDCLRLAFEHGRLRTALPEVLIENKRRALALHWRQTPSRMNAVLAAAAASASRLGPGFRQMRGRAVIEILPSVAAKGTAIRRMMTKPPFIGRRPVFVGDDITDESGFEAVNRLGGLSIRVGPALSTVARYQLPDVAAVRCWLAEAVVPALAGKPRPAATRPADPKGNGSNVRTVR